MQQLQVKLKNTPTDASQVCSSVSSVLNKEETPSVRSKVLTCNNLEGNLLQHTGEQNFKVSAIVYVLDMNGSPLMPTSPMRARKLLKSGKAKVAKRFPFTVKMTVPTGHNKQEVVLGIDSGYKRIGFSCVTPKKELLSGEVELDTKTKERLSERRMYRRNRRNKLWYRKPRFNNRKIENTWLAPSVLRNYNTHMTLVNKIKKLLPVTKVIVEVGNFDTQKLTNPEIEGKEYQQGNLYGFENQKAFVMFREKGKCQFCGKEKGNDTWRFHHITSRKTGSNSASNIALLHSKCHDKIHDKHLEKSIKSSGSYKESAFMNIVKNKFQKDLNCETTYGYITFGKRKELQLSKTHFNDAFVISSGSSQSRISPMLVIQKRKNNRSVQLNRKGFTPSIRKQRYIYQPKDLIWINGKECEVVGSHCCGSRVIIKREDTVKNISISTKKIQKHFMYNGLVWKQETKNATGKDGNSSPCLKTGVSLP